jgi:hypothetical protein
MKIRFLSALIPMVIAIPVAAFAQVGVEQPVKLALSLVGGLSSASGDFSDDWQASYSVGGEVDFTLVPSWVLTGTVAYHEAKPRFTTSTEKAKIMELGANIKYVFSATPAVKPYIRFGGGLYNRDVGSSVSETNAGLNGGAGVDLMLPGSPIGFSLIARFHKIFITSTSRQSGDWEFFNLWGGIRFEVL